MANPKLMQSPLKDGRISLHLEYYLGRSETPVLDEDGNQVYYSDGAMAGKPKYKIKHVRRKENLNLYLYANPKDAQEKIQNKNTLALAEKTRYEREQRFLEDREGYKFKRDTSLNFLDFFQQFIDESQHTHSYQSVSLVAFRRFKAFLSEMPRYAAYTTYIRPEQITKEMVKESNAKLADDISRLEMQKMRKVQDADLVKYKSEIERLFPDIPDLLTWANYCRHIGFTEVMTQKIIAMQYVCFSGSLYSSQHTQSFTTEHSVAQLVRESDKRHSFILKIDGVSVFQWFRDMARKLLEKMGFRQPQPKQGKGLHH